MSVRTHSTALSILNWNQALLISIDNCQSLPLLRTLFQLFQTIPTVVSTGVGDVPSKIDTMRWVQSLSWLFHWISNRIRLWEVPVCFQGVLGLLNGATVSPICVWRNNREENELKITNKWMESVDEFDHICSFRLSTLHTFTSVEYLKEQIGQMRVQTKETLRIAILCIYLAITNRPVIHPVSTLQAPESTISAYNTLQHFPLIIS